MKKKVIIGILIILILLVPIPIHLKDGGTVEYKSLSYKISKVHRLNMDSKTGYEDGWIIEILGIKVYDKVIADISSTNEKNKIEYNKADEVTWEEITLDGVNEELLLKNVDEELLIQIATELQTLVKEEQEEEKENPEIVITEGFVRGFKSERYKSVLNMGESAMKPLYLILYKSQNSGLYEYICANALYELSGYDFEWANSKEFMENFNKKIIENKQSKTASKLDENTENSNNMEKINMDEIIIKVNGSVLNVKLEDNTSAKAFVERLKSGDITISTHDYGNFEKVGKLGFSLPTNDKNITTEAGDLILYQGNQITLYYDTNSWNFTKLGKVQNVLQDELKEILGSGNVELTFSLND